jgi:hypothetical protein
MKRYRKFRNDQVFFEILPTNRPVIRIKCGTNKKLRTTPIFRSTGAIH